MAPPVIKGIFMMPILYHCDCISLPLSRRIRHVLSMNLQLQLVILLSVFIAMMLLPPTD